MNEAIEVQRMRYFRMIKVCNDTEHAVISDTYNVNVARYESHVFAVMFVTYAEVSFFFFAPFFFLFVGHAQTNQLDGYIDIEPESVFYFLHLLLFELNASNNDDE